MCHYQGPSLSLVFLPASVTMATELLLLQLRGSGGAVLNGNEMNLYAEHR